MKTEKMRLNKMLHENKISQEDYGILLTAIQRKSFFAKMQSSLLLNPFQKIAGFKALLIGMIILLLTSYLGAIAKLYFLGPLTAINALALAKQSISNEFLFLTYQNIVCWLVLAFLFVIVAKILQKKDTRVIDFLGTTSLARFPMLLVTTLTCLIRTYYPSMLDVNLSNGLPIHASTSQYLFSFIVTILGVWQIITYFYAFKESSGLVGNKLWCGFVAAIILGTFITQPLTALFMN